VLWLKPYQDPFLTADYHLLVSSSSFVVSLL
jgi:hypothetical protein